MMTHFCCCKWEYIKNMTLWDVQTYLQTLQTPSFSSIQAKCRFLQWVTLFFTIGNQLYRQRKSGAPLLVVLDQSMRHSILIESHEKLECRDTYGVFYHLHDRFYWPHMYQHVKHHVSTCHQCQIWSIKWVEVPPTICVPLGITCHMQQKEEHYVS